MTKEEVKAWLTKNEIILVRGPRGGLSAPFVHGKARNDVMDHLSEKISELVKERTGILEVGIVTLKNLVKSYKTENAQLKSIILDANMNSQKLQEEIDKRDWETPPPSPPKPEGCDPS